MADLHRRLLRATSRREWLQAKLGVPEKAAAKVWSTHGPHCAELLRLLWQQRGCADFGPGSPKSPAARRAGEARQLLAQIARIRRGEERTALELQYLDCVRALADELVEYEEQDCDGQIGACVRFLERGRDQCKE